MRLRHYLKGLGIGMVVTALILHFSVQAAEPSMTDEEVIARARELGMIENVVLARNDPTISGGSVSGGSAVSVSKDAVNDAVNNDSNGTDVAVDQPSDGEDMSVDGSGDTDVSADGHDIDPDTSGHENAPDAAEHVDTSAGDPLEEDITPAVGNDEEETELQEGMAGVEAGQDSDSDTDTVTVTVSNGDSSVSVAGKLAALGLVSSQAEYDAYLCSHGYDRTIRTGVHVIPVGATEQQIAEIITSKP